MSNDVVFWSSQKDKTNKLNNVRKQQKQNSENLTRPTTILDNLNNFQQIESQQISDNVKLRMSPQKQQQSQLPQNLTKDDNNKKMLNDLSEHGFIFGSNPRGLSTISTTTSFGGTTTTFVDNFTGSQQYQQNENESDNNISSCSTLDIDNKIQNTSLLELQNQIAELSQKLKQSEKDRNDLKQQLSEAIEERERSYRRLEVISSSHESRITEMHCVIAELSKKLRTKQDTTIMEENEAEGSEYSFQEGSIYNSETNLTNPDAECQTEPLDSEFLPQESQTLPITNNNCTQVQELQEEILHLKAEIALLQSQIANKTDSSPEAQRDETNLIKLPQKLTSNSTNYNDDDEKSDIHQSPLQQTKESLSDNEEAYLDNNFIQSSQPKYMKRNNIVVSIDNHFEKPFSRKTSKSEIPIAKMAERVKLRRTIEGHHISGIDIINSGLQNTEIVEHLVSDMIQSDNLIGDSIGPLQLQTEVQRLQRRLEHYKIRNSVLSLTLDECKEHCEHLYLLCGKYESNAIALQTALNCSDRAIEAYDVMLALLESKLAILKEKSPSAQESRKSVEAVACHLLDRLESEKNLNENSLGPWQNTVCISSSQFSEPWTQEDDNRLRNHVSKLKGRRSAVQNTVVTLESPFSTDYEKSRIAIEMNKDLRHENSQMDLEMAVLMQELLSLREDVIDTKQKTEIAERERNLAIEKVHILQDALSQLQSQLADSEALLTLASKDRSSYSEADHAAGIERQLVEALTRESQLKNRIQTLIGSVSACKKSSDEKYAQVQNNLTELQNANFNLSQSLELCKRKYQSRIKRLEQKMLEMSIEFGQHSCQLKGNEIVPETTL